MYFYFDDERPDTPSLDAAMSRREGIVLSVFLHSVVVGLILFIPTLPFVQAAVERRAAEAELRRERQLELQRARAREESRFVFVEPLVDIEALAPPERGELSDRDRVAQAPERALEPTNPLPFSRGNSFARVIADPDELPEGDGPAPDSAEGEDTGEDSADEDRLAEAAAREISDKMDRAEAPDVGDGADGADQLEFADVAAVQDAPLVASRSVPDPGAVPPESPVSGGALGEAIRNLERYVDRQSFQNPGGGGGAFGPSIQFDTMGVEFGPWIRRFIAQIKRNWFLPYAAMTLKGHSVITFYVHKSGALTDVTVVQPSSVSSFNLSARNALLTSNPTQPLPQEYPADRAFFTVTFYYNEQPPY